MWDRDFIVGVAGVAVGLVIAWIQKEQVEKVSQVAVDTKKIITKLGEETHKSKEVKKIFLLDKDLIQHRCYLPGKYHNKPLASIVAGDYYALHTLQELLREHRMDLCFQDKDSPDAQNPTDGFTVPESTIYLCTPQENPALRTRAEPLYLDRDEVRRPQFDKVDLPAWFAQRGDQKLIWTPDRELTSDAEGAYVACNQNRRQPPTVRSDFAIILRLSSPAKIFVIAGIHQYGTWIAGEYLRRIVTADDESIQPRDRDAFTRCNDFLAIIRGKFDERTLSVTGGISVDHLWKWQNGEWQERA